MCKTTQISATSSDLPGEPVGRCTIYVNENVKSRLGMVFGEPLRLGVFSDAYHFTSWSIIRLGLRLDTVLFMPGDFWSHGIVFTNNEFLSSH